jgi:hypothetical protein
MLTKSTSAAGQTQQSLSEPPMSGLTPRADMPGSMARVSSGPIVLKNSKIAGLRKSHKCSAFAISAAARRCRIDTRASDRFCGNSCGPSPRSESDAPAVLRIFSHQRKRTFSTQSANNRHRFRKHCHAAESPLDQAINKALCAAADIDDGGPKLLMRATRTLARGIRRAR